ncbi:VOC family protein [Pontibacter rugosus]|uniref:VOC family protein n=1 Tax=Pontibacter rugosus TaxID=1745966 RepID=A0ABW3SQI8_9BACT
MDVSLGRVVVLVHDYDEAYDFYHRNLGAFKLFDSETEDGQRYLHIGFGAKEVAGIWFMLAGSTESKELVGKQAGKQPLLVLYTSELDTVYSRLKQSEVRIVKEPVATPEAKFLHFLDLYGNELVLVQVIG